MSEKWKKAFPSLLAGGAIWLAIMGLMYGHIWLWRNWQEARLLRRDGVETPARVIALETHDSARGSDYCVVTFAYAAEESVWQRETRVGNDFCRIFSPGSQVTARYLPDNPELADLSWGGYLEAQLFAALFLDGAVAAGAVILWRRTRREAKGEPAQSAPAPAAPPDEPLPSPIAPAAPGSPPDAETAVAQFQAIWSRAQAIPEGEFYQHFESLRDEVGALGEPAMAAVLREARREPPEHLLEWLVYLLSDAAYRPALPDYLRWLEHENDEICFAAAVTVDNLANGRFGIQDLISGGWVPYDKIRARVPAMQQWGRQRLGDGVTG